MKTIQISYPALAQKIGVPELYIKREDLHKYGSHKGRSIPTMIKKYYKEEGITNFVISSSGNAALAAILAIKSHNQNNDTKLKLTVFVGPNIDESKLKLLLKSIDDPRIILEQVEKPKQTAFQLEKKEGTKFLRQSNDDNALFGYAELAEEIGKIPNLQAVFIPTSSGTTAQGINEAFKNLDKEIQIHIVQTESCHPIAEEFDKDFINKEKSIAGAIVDKIAFRKAPVVEAIKNSNGFGWIVNDEKIKQTKKLVKEITKLDSSLNSILSVAGLQKAIDKNWKFDGAVMCIFTGR